MALAKCALQCFLDQTYEDRELVIHDDFDDRSFPDGVDHPLVRYHISDYRHGRFNIPQKRNAVNQLASGSLICHFDSDDWSAPERIAEQVKLLKESGRACTGFHSMIFFDETTRKAARYETPIKNPPNFYALGTSLCYRRDFWHSHRYRESMAIGSDNDFVRRTREEKQLVSVDAGTMMVARSHPGNTGAKNIAGSNYVSVSLDLIPTGFFT